MLLHKILYIAQIKLFELKLKIKKDHLQSKRKKIHKNKKPFFKKEKKERKNKVYRLLLLLYSKKMFFDLSL